jgi:hypothetical protein
LAQTSPDTKHPQLLMAEVVYRLRRATRSSDILLVWSLGVRFIKWHTNSLDGPGQPPLAGYWPSSLRHKVPVASANLFLYSTKFIFQGVSEIADFRNLAIRGTNYGITAVTSMMGRFPQLYLLIASTFLRLLPR